MADDIRNLLNMPDVSCLQLWMKLSVKVGGEAVKELIIELVLAPGKDSKAWPNWEMFLKRVFGGNITSEFDNAFALLYKDRDVFHFTSEEVFHSFPRAFAWLARVVLRKSEAFKRALEAIKAEDGTYDISRVEHVAKCDPSTEIDEYSSDLLNACKVVDQKCFDRAKSRWEKTEAGEEPVTVDEPVVLPVQGRHKKQKTGNTVSFN
eukprot:130792_1